VRLIPRDEAIQAIEALGGPCCQDLSPSPGSGLVASRLDRYPKTIAAVVPAASALARWLTAVHPCEVMVLVKDHAIFPNSEHLPTFAQWRRATSGDASSLADRPGHALDCTQLAELIGLLQFGLVYAWDVIAVSPWRAVSFDHDEHLFVRSASEHDWGELLR